MTLTSAAAGLPARHRATTRPVRRLSLRPQAADRCRPHQMDRPRQPVGEKQRGSGSTSQSRGQAKASWLTPSVCCAQSSGAAASRGSGAGVTTAPKAGLPDVAPSAPARVGVGAGVAVAVGVAVGVAMAVGWRVAVTIAGVAIAAGASRAGQVQPVANASASSTVKRRTCCISTSRHSRPASALAGQAQLHGAGGDGLAQA